MGAAASREALGGHTRLSSVQGTTTHQQLLACFVEI